MRLADVLSARPDADKIEIRYVNKYPSGKSSPRKITYDRANGTLRDNTPSGSYYLYRNVKDAHIRKLAAAKMTISRLSDYTGRQSTFYR